MSTQTKKIQKKIAPKDPVAKESNLKPKASRDILLLILIGMTLLILVAAWPNLDTIGRGMYASLFAGMVVVYINRHANFSEKVKKILIVVSLSLLFLCLLLLCLSIYFQYFA